MSIIEFNSVTLGYANKTVLEDVNLKVEPGELFGLVGPNGSGKTTLLKAMLGQLKPWSGSVNWKTTSSRWGYVPQREQVDPIWPVTVQKLLRMTVRSTQTAWIFSKEKPEIVEQVIEMTGLKKFSNQTLETLSGGELQRVLLARALVVEPDILLLDEPTAAMDLVAAAHFLDLIVKLHEIWEITVVLVSHDLSALADRTDRIGILRCGNLYSGPTDSMLTSKNLSDVYGRSLKVEKTTDKTVIYPD